MHEENILRIVIERWRKKELSLHFNQKVHKENTKKNEVWKVEEQALNARI